jgi:DNA-binding NarL/FixJ family response regulator
MPDAPIRVLLADDHPVYRQGLAMLLSGIDGIEVVGTAADGAEAERAAADLTPDVVLMDVSMPVLNGVEATRRILTARPDTAVLMLTMSNDDTTLLAAMHAGATGYLLKDAGPDEIGRAIAAAANGEAIFGAPLARRMTTLLTTSVTNAAPFPQLTSREHEILALVARGLTNPQIAKRLNLSPKAIRNNVSHIFAKLQVSDRAEATEAARSAGLA